MNAPIDGRSLLHFAADYGQLEVLDYLVNHSIPVFYGPCFSYFQCKDMTCLGHLFFNYSVKMVEFEIGSVIGLGLFIGQRLKNDVKIVFQKLIDRCPKQVSSLSTLYSLFINLINSVFFTITWF